MTDNLNGMPPFVRQRLMWADDLRDILIEEGMPAMPIIIMAGKVGLPYTSISDIIKTMPRHANSNGFRR